MDELNSREIAEIMNNGESVEDKIPYKFADMVGSILSEREEVNEDVY